MSEKKLRKDAREIFNDALDAADPKRCVFEHVSLKDGTLSVDSQNYKISDYKSIFVVAFGKAASLMAKSVEELLGNSITEGIVISNSRPDYSFNKMDFYLSSHPMPDDKSLQAAIKVTSLLDKTGEDDLVIFLISGGGSSILAMPREGISIEEKRKVTEKLLLSGVDTHGINTVRKKLSQIKGGGLLKKAIPAQIITLILSDVVGDKLDVIASGPTVADTATFEEAWRVIEALKLEHVIPPKVLVHLDKGRKGLIPKLLTKKELNYEKQQTVIVGNNYKSLVASEKKANDLGYNTLLLSSQISGEAKEVAKVIAGIAFEIERLNTPVKKPACIIFGGETTVNVTGSGKGGRNTETAIAFCMEIIGHSNIVGLFSGTDGIDGPTDAAGAICDGNSRLVARTHNTSARDHLADNNSYNFFERLDDLIKTGPTGTNVMDIGIVLIEE
ncbi:MAG: glycerate kinase type-2 family protein [Thermodesulfobacteriota bacterium]